MYSDFRQFRTIFARRAIGAGLLAGFFLLTGCGGGGDSSSGGGPGPVTVVVVPPTTPPITPPPVLTTTPITQFANDPLNPGVQVVVTSPNTLAPGAIIIISGTTNYNGTYVIVSATATTFTITKVFAGNDATGGWQPGGGLIAGCNTTGATGAITLSHTASRFSGIGPLAVFFDATATTATAAPTAAEAFHKLEYRWDFGDPLGSPISGTTWSRGSRAGSSSRDRATGPVAAHVYERPGTYVVTVTVFDGVNTVSNACFQIAVVDPEIVFAGANTVCFSASGAAPGCPGPVQIANSNFTTALSGNQGTGKRLLFACGETFTAVGSSGIISAAGPGTVGAFPVGCAGRPVIQPGTGNSILEISTNSHTPATTDWRVMDLTFDGGAFPTTAFGIALAGGMTRLTVLRSDMTNLRVGFQVNQAVLDLINVVPPFVPMYDQIFLVDSTIQNVQTNGGYGAFTSATRYAVLGNYLFDAETFGPGVGGHLMRVPFGQKVVISNNEFNKSAASKALLTIRAPDFAGTATIAAGSYTEEVLVSDNKFVGTATAELTSFIQATIGVDERLRNVIAERNWYVYGAGTSSGLRNQASFATIRNNVTDMSASTSTLAFKTEQPGGVVVPTQDQIAYYNNTVYTSAVSASTFTMLDLANSPTNLSVVNNLAYGPNFTATFNMVAGVPGAGATIATNSTSAPGGGQIKNTDPLFTSVAPFNPTNAKPTGTCALPGASYAICAGTAVPVWSDFFPFPLVAQPAVRTIGAVNP